VHVCSLGCHLPSALLCADGTNPAHLRACACRRCRSVAPGGRGGDEADPAQGVQWRCWLGNALLFYVLGVLGITGTARYVHHRYSRVGARTAAFLVLSVDGWTLLVVESAMQMCHMLQVRQHSICEPFPLILCVWVHMPCLLLLSCNPCATLGCATLPRLLGRPWRRTPRAPAQNGS